MSRGQRCDTCAYWGPPICGTNQARCLCDKNGTHTIMYAYEVCPRWKVDLTKVNKEKDE